MKIEDLMTPQELEALDLTKKLWAAILEIEGESRVHPDDIHEHRRDIHDIQSRIMARPVERILCNEKQNPSD